MSDTALVVMVVVVVLIAVATVLIVRRRRYIRDLRDRGWTFVNSPTLESVLDHQAPPFGLGFERLVDESISGATSTGVHFHVFEYSCRDGGPSFDERLASLQLPTGLPALPPLFVSSGRPRTGAHLPSVDLGPGWEIRAFDPDYAATVLTAQVRQAIGEFASVAGRIDLSIDGSHLVAVGAPKQPDALHAYLEALAPVVCALDVAALAPYAAAPPPARFGFFGRPDWTLIERDDSLIDKYGLTRDGTHHRTERIIRGSNDGLPLEAFVHRWQTTRTVTDTDSEGKSRTRTVTDKHVENVTAVWLPFRLPQLSINGGWGGARVKFELEEFNDRFKVRTSHAKFAYDVLQPRTIEYLMAVNPPGLEIEGDLVRFPSSKHDTLEIGRCADFVHELLARVPSFVWSDLGVTAPKFRSAASD